MKKEVTVLLIILQFLVSNSLFAQDGVTASHGISYSIPSLSLVDIEGGASINLALSPSSEAGLGMSTSSTDNSLWLNYSSTTVSSVTNTISVKVSGLLPGIAIKVIASSDAAAGGGVTGTPASIVTLSTSDQSIITDIGTCYTGDGTNRGHNLTYSLETTDYSLIKYTATPNTVTITYTVTNN